MNDARARTRATRIDFDGDGKTDLLVYRPSPPNPNALLQVLLSSQTGGSQPSVQIEPGDIPVPADYDGDGKTDFAVFRASDPAGPTWYVLYSRSEQLHSVQLGAPGDIPVPGDYDGDGQADMAVFHPSTATWSIVPSSGSMKGQLVYTQNHCQTINSLLVCTQQYGQASVDIPVPGDYDGDGKTDMAVFRPTTATWYVLESSSAQGAQMQQQFGTPGADIPVPGDYDGDQKTDFAVFHLPTAAWYVLKSSDPTHTQELAQQYGTAGVDIPVPGDYDGDGITDFAVFHPSNSAWYYLSSRARPSIDSIGQQFGQPGVDFPISDRVPAFSISGHVSNGANPAVGAIMTVSAPFPLTASTDSNGNYSMLVLSQGSYAVTPTLDDSVFSPASATFKQVTTNQTANFSTNQEVSNGIDYHGGPVMLGSTNIYYVWYGNWSTSDPIIGILEDLGKGIGGSPYFNILTTYFDGSDNHVTNTTSFAQHFFDSNSQETTILSDAQIEAIVQHAIQNGLPLDSNGVYLVLTSADLMQTPDGTFKSNGFCSAYLGWHGSGIVTVNNNSADIKYGFIGDPSQHCSQAEPPAAYSPNGNAAADEMASVIAHELAEAITDPDLDAWFANGSGNEAADLCLNNYGSVLPGGPPYANVVLGNRSFFLQTLWVNASNGANNGYCALSYPSH